MATSDANKSVKSISTTRSVDVFVSRLHPITEETELIASVNSINSDLKLMVHEVNCVKLKA